MFAGNDAPRVASLKKVHIKTLSQNMNITTKNQVIAKNLIKGELDSACVAVLLFCCFSFFYDH
jgi:hypothetical protein